VEIANVVHRLAEVVGKEKAEDLVLTAARELGIRIASADESAIEQILAKLAQHPGVIGTASRVALRRAQMDAALAQLDAPTPEVAAQAPVVSSPRTPYETLVALLSPALGEEKATSLLEAAARNRGVSAAHMRRHDCLAVLEDLTAQEGLVGTVARFAKARAHLEIPS
jgi:hypothetical protein